MLLLLCCVIFITTFSFILSPFSFSFFETETKKKISDTRTNILARGEQVIFYSLFLSFLSLSLLSQTKTNSFNIMWQWILEAQIPGFLKGREKERERKRERERERERERKRKREREQRKEKKRKREKCSFSPLFFSFLFFSVSNLNKKKEL